MHDGQAGDQAEGRGGWAVGLFSRRVNQGSWYVMGRSPSDATQGCGMMRTPQLSLVQGMS